MLPIKEVHFLVTKMVKFLMIIYQDGVPHTTAQAIVELTSSPREGNGRPCQIVDEWEQHSIGFASKIRENRFAEALFCTTGPGRFLLYFYC